ncbi:Pre-mRNA-processing protein 40B [Capsicum chinense]|nr:Pre-mRNA-processing protein 40B [Capsicum chinense]
MNKVFPEDNMKKEKWELDARKLTVSKLIRFGEEAVLNTLIQLALDIGNGLCYLHSEKIADRDGKTENLLLDKSGRIKMIDFGIYISIEKPPIPPLAGPAHGTIPSMSLYYYKKVTRTSKWRIPDEVKNVKKDATITKIGGATPSDEKTVELGPFVNESKVEAKSAFKTLLESANIGSDCTWDQAMRAVINDQRYGALKSLCERKQAFNEASRQWQKVQDRLETDKRCSRLEKIYRLEIFQEYIRDLESEEKEQRKLQMEEFRKAERKNRDEFRKLMEEHVAAGMLNAKTNWRDYCIKIKDFAAYLAVSSNTLGSTAKDLFTDVMDELEK